MRYLLDTCAWLWLLDDPEHLSDKARQVLLLAETYPVGLASISLWEVARKESLGKLILRKPSSEWLKDACAVPGIERIELSHTIAWDSCHLPGEFHRDPADQIIVATARARKLTVITTDKRILDYEHVTTLKA